MEDKITIINGISSIIDLTKKLVKKTPEYSEQLIAARECATQMQDIILELQDENKRLKKALEIKSEIHRNPKGYVTLDGDREDIKYCSRCWDSNYKTIMLIDNNGAAICPVCKTKVVYDAEKYWSPLQEMF